MGWSGKIGVVIQNRIGKESGTVDETRINKPFGKADISKTALRRAENIPGTAKTEILLRNFKAVGGSTEDVELFAGRITRFSRGNA